MPLGVAALGTFSYNGVVFDGASSVVVTVEPEWDKAGRSIASMKHTFDVHAFFATTQSGGDLDGQMATVKFKLLQPGKTLVFAQRGFGLDLTVNGGGGVQDVAWGPKPTMLKWTPIGGNRAAEVDWQVTTSVPICSDSPGNLGRTSGVSALTYTVTFDVTEAGFTTRTIAGELKIALTRQPGSRLVRDVADAYRDKIAPEKPPNYQRKTNWKTSLDRTTLEFTIVDTQIESRNALPQGVVAADGRHRVSWSRNNKGMMTLRNTIEVTLSPKLTVSAATAWVIFGQLLASRIAAARSGDTSVLIDDVEVEESIWGVPVSAKCSYRVLSKLENIVTQTGLWTPIGTDWPSWTRSIADVQNHRGIDKLFYMPYNDALVDLCTTAPTSTSSPGQYVTGPQTYLAPAIANKYPPANKSYLEYKASIDPYRSGSTYRQSYMQRPESDTASGDMTASGGLSFPPQGRATVDDVIARAGANKYGARFHGYARRVGFEVPRPALKFIGGVEATETGGTFACVNLGDHLGVPVYEAKWDLDYSLPRSPGKITPPPNMKG